MVHSISPLKKINYVVPQLFIIEQANEILSSFDVGLRQYAINHLTKVSWYYVA